MSKVLKRLIDAVATFANAVEKLLSPEILIADMKVAQKKVAVPIWRRRSNSFMRINQVWNRMPHGSHAGLGMLLLLIMLTFWVRLPQQGFEVRLVMDNYDAATGLTGYSFQSLGVLRSADALSSWIDSILNDNDYPEDYNLFIHPGISVQPVLWYPRDGSYADPHAVYAKLRSSVEVLAEASVIHIPSKSVALPVANARAANQVFDNVQLHYVGNYNVNTINAMFEDQDSIFLERARMHPDMIVSIEEATAELLVGYEEPRTVMMQIGDSIWDLAASMLSEYNLDMDIDEAMEEIYQLNPHIVGGVIKPGDVLNLPTQNNPLLGVTVTETVETYETINFGYEVSYTSDLYRNTTDVIRYGIPGVKVVTESVTTQNGYVIARQRLGEVVLEEPVAQIELRGDKPYDDRGSGYFVWPIYGRVTSHFGWRSLLGGFHNGVDIASGGSGGAVIRASDSGIVTYAGWDNGGLGYLVTIDHQNGFVTRYAHMTSNLYVQVGDGVQQGVAIGIEGNTGISFGAHLHFEMLLHGSRVNPLDYISD